MFEPTLVPSSGSYSSVTYHNDNGGSYVKIGSMVLCQICVRVTAVNLTGASVYTTIQNLPFAADARTAAGDNSEYVAHIHATGDWDSGKAPSGAYLSPGSTTVYLYYNTNGTSASVPLDYNHFDETGDFRAFMTIMYRTAD